MKRIPLPPDQPTEWLPYLNMHSHCSVFIPLDNAQAELDDFAWIREHCGDHDDFVQRWRTQHLVPAPGLAVSW